MTLPPDERIKFFVFVIESPSPVDLYHRRSEGEIIRQAVNLNQIPCIVRTAINVEAFEASIKIGLKEEMEAYPGLIPMLHISAHGSTDGIQLSNGQTLSWEALKELLQPINKALSNSLLVCLSCCEGYAGIRMAMTHENVDQPFYALVANGSKPLWADTAVAYSSFYHLVAKGEYIKDAVNAMRVASGNNFFWVETADGARQTFLEHIKNINTEQVQKMLEENATQEEPRHLDKLRKVARENTP